MARMRSTVLALAAGLVLAGCGINITEDHTGHASEVDIQTPLGDLSVRTDVDPEATGLAVHPGARLLREHGDHPDSANVDLRAFSFGLNVVAATFEDPAPPDEVAAFYRRELAAYGEVTECRGDIDFRGRNREPVCRARGGSRELQLVAGTEGAHRLVSVKPRGEGAEFALVYVRTSDEG